MSAEKVAAWCGILVFVAGVVLAYASLNNRLDNMDGKIADIQKSLGSAACNAILPRQIEAIEKSRKEAREALEALSRQYDCGPRHVMNAATSVDVWANAAEVENASAPGSNLSAQLHSVDLLLKDDSNAFGAHRK